MFTVYSLDFAFSDQTHKKKKNNPKKTLHNKILFLSCNYIYEKAHFQRSSLRKEITVSDWNIIDWLSLLEWTHVAIHQLCAYEMWVAWTDGIIAICIQLTVIPLSPWRPPARTHTHTHNLMFILLPKDITFACIIFHLKLGCLSYTSHTWYVIRDIQLFMVISTHFNIRIHV